MVGVSRVAMLLGAGLVLVAAVAGAGGSMLLGGADAACSVQELHEEPAVLAPLTNDIGNDYDGGAWSCYVVYGIPSFPFRGVVSASLSDGINSASWTRTCYMTGLEQLGLVPPVVGCEGVSSRSPALAPGTLHLSCSARATGSEPAAIGTWGCAVGFGNPS